ncbi:ComEA family DNA-binding protein [Candidatus Bipolaricaulota bacterium]|nr:ComEA family DNA-binding protein [Candidatus Bipolaricaulota bacterium]
MNPRLSPAQERGLIVLVAIGLVASGLALFLPTIRSRPLTILEPIEPIDITGVRVLLPTFLDAEEKDDMVNLNTASAEELTSLPGIGEVLAARIVAYREEHGPFQTLDDLMQVSGIGSKVVEEIRDLVTVGD